jgi:hypothetical protein
LKAIHNSPSKTGFFIPVLNETQSFTRMYVN